MMSEGTKIEVAIDGGTAPCWIHRPASAAGELPGLLMFPDALSVRPSQHELAARAAALGHVVLVPHVHYRAGEMPRFDPLTVWGDAAERARLRALLGALDTASAMRDAAAYIAALRGQPGVRPGPIGTFGYCMGGRLAFTAAGAFPDDIAAVASIHGGGVCTDAPDSPHRQAAKIRAELYFAVTTDDATCTAAQTGTLATALMEAKLRFTIEHYAGKGHGFAVRDLPPYDAAATELHWARVGELFGRVFRR